ncbi:cytochrome P460 family protein [Citreimonas salinaria]|uniref:Cytochrome P460 n=1 Tax=Citreimonas salinaria TaxID=321339 RepID=A0A1H3KZI8_9RHOB|nr:cytochrome P460 family protein [Citreimonas salinaria]SDY57602.1 Cytochrome P460 [Citreimonas salinaria]
MKLILIGGALTLAATIALAQDFGGQEDQDYAAQLWQAMQERNLAGDDAVQAFPYEGTDPHGMMLETSYTDATIDGHTGALVIKRNYGPEGVTVDQVLGSPGDHLGAVTIMFRRGEDYAPDSGNWFWAKYLPDGSLDQTPDGMPIAGKAQGCIDCHASAEGEDFLFTTNADLR